MTQENCLRNKSEKEEENRNELELLEQRVCAHPAGQFRAVLFYVHVPDSLRGCKYLKLIH
jgi:hypothetical protein